MYALAGTVCVMEKRMAVYGIGFLRFGARMGLRIHHEVYNTTRNSRDLKHMSSILSEVKCMKDSLS